MDALFVWSALWYLYRSQKLIVFLHSKRAKFEVEKMVRVGQRLWLWNPLPSSKTNVLANAFSGKKISKLLQSTIQLELQKEIMV